MADKPSYYGSGSGPQYYGSGTGPKYYGGGAYGGAPAYGGAYGQPRSYSAPSGGDDGSIVGTITIGRMLRVISQRWLSVFVFLLIGLVVSFAVYKISPTVYEARSSFTMDMRRSSGSMGRNALDQAMPDFGSSYAEIFNTRIPDWRSEKIVTRIVQQYRANHPASTVSDEQIISTLGGSKLDLQRNSRIINITVRSGVPALAAALANAYAEAIEAFTDDENKIRCDKAVSQIHGNVEKRRREVDKIAKQLLDFRTANKVDNLRSMRDTVQQGLSKTTSDILALETSETQLIEWEKLLIEVQKDPESFGNLSTGVPRAEEIANEYRQFQDDSGAYASLLVAYTENHPEVLAAKKRLEMSRQRFLDAVSRALLTGRSTLQVTRNQLGNMRNKQEDLRNELASLEQRIVLAESGLGQLEAEFKVSNNVLEGLIMDENKARMDAEANNEIVRLATSASVPSKPVLPNPLMIFGAGVAVSIGLGLLFVLVMDNLEDTVVNLSDIEGRLSLKVLAVLPHVRRKKREQVAKFMIEDKYSQFSEAVAGLRNLLESPRYESLTKCMLVISTQPGEGKTITSTSIAISHAQTGKRTLLVDFDLRRPRLARIWGVDITDEKSFSHALQNADAENPPDFSSLVNETALPNLSVICSMPPEGINPATILGSKIVPVFLDWAREHYDKIIIDSPPFGLVGDVVTLATLVDSAIIMCCPDRTHFKPIQYCARCLTEAGANIIGVIVNDVEVSSQSAFSPSRHHGGYRSGYKSGYGYGGYGYGGYGYGYGYGYSSSRRHKKTDTGTEKPDDAAGKGNDAANAEKPAEPQSGTSGKLEMTDEE